MLQKQKLVLLLSLYYYRRNLTVLCDNSRLMRQLIKLIIIGSQKNSMQMETNKDGELTIIANIKKQFTNFIQTYQDRGEIKYKRQVQIAVNNGRRTILISLIDFINYNHQLAGTVFDNFYKYQPHLNQALTQFIHQYEKTNSLPGQNKSSQQQMERYQVAFNQGYSSNANDSVRQLKSQSLGKLKSFRGTVTRTSQVRPELLIGIFKCTNCGTYSKEVPQQFKYTEPKKCLKNNCDSSTWELDLKKSRFADFQKIRVQEDPTKIPPGAMPRSIDVILRNDNTQKGQPGDILHVVGYLAVSPDISSMLKPGQRTQVTTKDFSTRGNLGELEGVTGVKGIRQLNYKLIFIGIHIKVENNQFSEDVQQNEDEEQIMMMEMQDQKSKFTNQYFLAKIYSKLTEQEITQIQKMKSNPRLYDDLSQSLFPSIFGHSQIKKALLLQLFGGIHKKTQTKINIRGDVNILIVGDPSTAKSQFLKCVNKFVPRSVYTNGKTTSAAGLTASVTKDENGNIGIQAGALMLADNGICCIDEFDKMDIKDQVAIHQAMQQQTISIAKAGVYATLNARTSILAAANPLFGRYDKSKALKYNINISPPIMSRFDLFFVICDQTDNLADLNLARFIVDLHRNKRQLVNVKYDYHEIKKYITVAKKIKPRLTKQAGQLLKKFYIELRTKDKSQNQNTSYRITVRQLESMIRLSEAYARLELDPEIKAHHVKQAHRLLSCSILKLQKAPIQLNTQQQLLQQMGRMNLINQNLMQEEIQRKRQQKKSKHVSISHEIYQEIQKNVSKLFKQKQKRHQEGVQNIKISQQDLCNYLLGINFETGVIGSQEETEHMKKILNAVIKKLIREQRMLIILQQSSDPSLRLIGLHPNYEQ